MSNLCSALPVWSLLQDHQQQLGFSWRVMAFLQPYLTYCSLHLFFHWEQIKVKVSVKEHYGLEAWEYLKGDLSLCFLCCTLWLVLLAGEKILSWNSNPSDVSGIATVGSCRSRIFPINCIRTKVKKHFLSITYPFRSPGWCLTLKELTAGAIKLLWLQIVDDVSSRTAFSLFHSPSWDTLNFLWSFKRGAVKIHVTPHREC